MHINEIYMCVLVAQLCPTLCDPRTVAHQAPLSMEFSRQEYWSGLPFPSPGHLPNPEIESRSPTLQADSLLSEPLSIQVKIAGNLLKGDLTIFIKIILMCTL